MLYSNATSLRDIHGSLVHSLPPRISELHITNIIITTTKNIRRNFKEGHMFIDCLQLLGVIINCMSGTEYVNTD